jgi:hypothetical protein
MKMKLQKNSDASPSSCVLAFIHPTSYRTNPRNFSFTSQQLHQNLKLHSRQVYDEAASPGTFSRMMMTLLLFGGHVKLKARSVEFISNIYFSLSNVYALRPHVCRISHLQKLSFGIATKSLSHICICSKMIPSRK